MSNNVTITHDAAAMMFKITQPEGEAYLDYSMDNGNLVVLHTVVPPALGGRGYGALLAQAAYDYAAEHHHAFKYECSFVGAWAKKNHIEQ
ncbi:MAG: N-acetyltransferase [Treponema sp.]|nr:N-acetyltransferase [Treponema sp.]